jgi:hypothetical protein
MSYSFNNPIQYYLVRDSRVGNLEAEFNKINDYLLTFVGDIAIEKLKEGLIEISYSEVNFKSTLETGSNIPVSDQIISSQILLTCEKEDNLSVHLLKNVTKNIGYRIFNPQTKSYLVSNPDMLDLTNANIKQDILQLIRKYNLEPFSQHRSALIFFATDKKGQVHLINRHLLEYLIVNPETKVQKEDFSVVVSNDIGRFVALFDRGLIPYSFYEYINHRAKISNQSGFNLDTLNLDIIIDPIYFNFDLTRQSFIQSGSSSLNERFSIKKGESVIKILTDRINKKGQKYLALKFPIDIGFIKKKQSLVPKLSVSIYLDE